MDTPGGGVIFFVGAVLIILAIPIALRLREPEPWIEAHRKACASGAKSGSKRVGSLAELFGDPRWRKNALVGIALGLAGMAGLWGIGILSPELHFRRAEGRAAKCRDGRNARQRHGDSGRGRVLRHADLHHCGNQGGASSGFLWRVHPVSDDDDFLFSTACAAAAMPIGCCR